MSGVSEAAKKLKTLRVQTKLSMREVAEILGMEKPSSYQHYEDRYRKEFLPVDIARKLAPLFASRGVPADEVLALAGIGGAAPSADRAIDAFSGDWRVHSEGQLSAQGAYQLLVSGPFGPKERDRLIRKLQLEQEIAADEDGRKSA